MGLRIERRARNGGSFQARLCVLATVGRSVEGVKTSRWTMSHVEGPVMDTFHTVEFARVIGAMAVLRSNEMRCPTPIRIVRCR
jgi:hypothetical protein